MRINRRSFLQQAAGAAAAASGAFRFAPGILSAQGGPLPRPDESGIDHIVVVMMENRSFDHFLGWLPNADGRQAGLTYLDASNVAHATHPLAPDFTGCGHPDPDHSYLGARQEYNGGAMDGFRRTGTNDDYAIGYYVEADRPFFNTFARNYTTLDRSFSSILGPTFPNRFFLHCAQTDRLDNSLAPSTLPTIWDSLLTAGVSAAYYFSNVPFLGFWLGKYIPISFPYAVFLQQAQLGLLPQVSFVDPIFEDFNADDGSGNDDHPHADIRRGDAFLATTFHALATSPVWDRTVLIVTYDEWGGFFDHVPPPRATAPNGVDPDLVRNKALLGMRVPSVIASPFSRGEPSDPKVKSMIFDHTSILKLIEWRFGLAPLTARDGSNDIQNLARALNFHQVDPGMPNVPLPVEPAPAPCSQPAGFVAEGASRWSEAPGLSQSRVPWRGVRQLAEQSGWTIGR
jgi:phospholipase C